MFWSIPSPRPACPRRPLPLPGRSWRQRIGGSAATTPHNSSRWSPSAMRCWLQTRLRSNCRHGSKPCGRRPWLLPKRRRRAMYASLCRWPTRSCSYSVSADGCGWDWPCCAASWPRVRRSRRRLRYSGPAMRCAWRCMPMFRPGMRSRRFLISNYLRSWRRLMPGEGCRWPCRIRCCRHSALPVSAVIWPGLSCGGWSSRSASAFCS